MEPVLVVNATLAAALEHIPDAAFVIGADGTIVHTNAAARRRMAEDGERVAGDLAHAVSEGEPGLDLRLVIVREEDRVAPMAANAATRWCLTARQREVLECIVRGFSNLRTALELGISERTVEVHLSAIFGRSSCGSRAELITSVLL